MQRVVKVGKNSFAYYLLHIVNGISIFQAQKVTIKKIDLKC